MHVKSDVVLNVWSSWGVADQILKSPSRRGLQLNRAQLVVFKFTNEDWPFCHQISLLRISLFFENVMSLDMAKFQNHPRARPT